VTSEAGHGTPAVGGGEARVTAEAGHDPAEGGGQTRVTGEAGDREHSAAGGAETPVTGRDPRDAAATRRLCVTVLVMETVVIWLSIPVALAVDRASPGRIGVPGVILAVLAVVLAVLARRRLRWTIVGGSVLQVLVIAAGVIVPVMYFLGAIFAAFWVIGLRLGHRLDVAS
jgi:hypothetical protein